MKKINNLNTDKLKKSNTQSKSENYHALSKLDVKVLLREINQSFAEFLNKHNLDKKGKILLSGRNSQHKNLVELIGKSLKIDVALISPVNNFAIKEFSYNPDDINQFSMSRIIGLGLSLLKNDHLEDDSLSRDFIIQDFSYDKFIEQESKNIGEIKDIEDRDDIENSKIKEGLKSKIEDKKKELPALTNLKIKNKAEPKSKIEDKKKELPPLPNLKIKDKAEPKSKIEDKKKELPPLPNIKKTKENTQMNKKDLPENVEKLNNNPTKKENTQINKKDLPENLENLNNNPTKKENKSFKMDKSFLQDD